LKAAQRLGRARLGINGSAATQQEWAGLLAYSALLDLELTGVAESNIDSFQLKRTTTKNFSHSTLAHSSLRDEWGTPRQY
jgi:hypothetical protein